MRNILIKKNLRFISSILCCVVFLLTTPFISVDATANNTTAATGSRIIVSLGDSYSAGEGVPDFYGQNEPTSVKVHNQDWLAHRSTKSWSGQLTLPGVSGTMSTNRNTNWFFVASSGAVTADLYGRQPKEYDRSGYSGTNYIDAQLDVFDNLNGEEAEYVTLTLGGNDAKFAEVIETAAKACLNPSSLADKLNKIWLDFYSEENGIRIRLYRAYKDIAAAAGAQAKIIVAGYPTLLDQSGNGMLFSKEEATMINDSVRRFNKEIEAIVNACKSEGMKICFVSVEQDFNGYEAYSSDPYINKVKLTKNDEDLKGGPSAYSMHPNEKGIEVYRKCVQNKIDSIEKDGGKSEWPDMSNSDERDIVLALDVSGSMSGEPMEETKTASKKFISAIAKEDASLGIVTYDSTALTVSDFCMNEGYLKDIVNSINSGGGTDTEAGLLKAEEMLDRSNAKKKIIVLMSDGEPNEGKTGDALIEYANQLKDKGIYIYTLGFFNSSSSKTSAQSLMQGIASEGCHYEVDDASQLVFFFEDIADQIRGTKYTYIRIACPVDVSVSYDGEELSSKDATKSQRTDFGTLTFEENPEVNDESSDNRIKILRLKEGNTYDVHISGNGKGKMSYTIGFMDENGEYSDLRKFNNIKIRKSTEIDTVAANTKNTTLKVDEDGDGKYDYVYKATANGRGEIVDYGYVIHIMYGIIIVTLLAAVLIILIASKRRKKRKNQPMA